MKRRRKRSKKNSRQAVELARPHPPPGRAPGNKTSTYECVRPTWDSLFGDVPDLDSGKAAEIARDSERGKALVLQSVGNFFMGKCSKKNKIIFIHGNVLFFRGSPSRQCVQEMAAALRKQNKIRRTELCRTLFFLALLTSLRGLRRIQYNTIRFISSPLITIILI